MTPRPPFPHSMPAGVRELLAQRERECAAARNAVDASARRVAMTELADWLRRVEQALTSDGAPDWAAYDAEIRPLVDQLALWDPQDTGHWHCDMLRPVWQRMAAHLQGDAGASHVQIDHWGTHIPRARPDQDEERERRLEHATIRAEHAWSRRMLEELDDKQLCTLVSAMRSEEQMTAPISDEDVALQRRALLCRASMYEGIIPPRLDSIGAFGARTVRILDEANGWPTPEAQRRRWIQAYRCRAENADTLGYPAPQTLAELRRQTRALLELAALGDVRPTRIGMYVSGDTYAQLLENEAAAGRPVPGDMQHAAYHLYRVRSQWVQVCYAHAGSPTAVRSLPLLSPMGEIRHTGEGVDVASPSAAWSGPLACTHWAVSWRVTPTLHGLLGSCDICGQMVHRFDAHDLSEELRERWELPDVHGREYLAVINGLRRWEGTPPYASPRELPQGHICVLPSGETRILGRRYRPLADELFAEE